MVRASIAPAGCGVGRIVANFEAAWIVEGDADPARFLPEAGHRDRVTALLELIRLDMEHRRAAGRPRRARDYLREFPELRQHEAWGLIEAESAPPVAPAWRASARPARDRHRFDFESWDGPGPGPGDAAASPPESAPFESPAGRFRVDPAQAARSYLDFRLSHGGGGIESWVASHELDGDAATVDVILDLHRSDPEAAGRLAEAVVSLPGPGDTFLGFRLLAELGRGAFGRVFLASQGELAGRPVALKVSAQRPDESQTLAQLQHTNIVPIFSAHQVGALHAVCMPYFGSTTLKDVLEELEDAPSMPTSGQGLLKTLASHRDAGSSSSSSWRFKASAEPTAASLAVAEEAEGVAPGPSTSPPLSSDTLALLGRLSYVDAILWIGARLADGLAHAHGRGILHRDLKPANVLLTDGGQPMLLDFNLSEDTKKPASAASVGGTLPYMAPEHLRAFRGRGPAVDACGDIYALGIILYELLAGRHPFAAHPGASAAALDRMIAERSRLPAGLRGRNPRVSPAVESIVRHCLEPDPARRYRSAAELREDLERHMADLPLRHAAEPSPRERLGKWSRRHPRLSSSTAAAILLGCVALGVLGGLMARARRLCRLEAVASLARFREECSTVRYLLNTRVADLDRRAVAVARGREALRPYGVLVDPAWRSRASVASLEPGERRDLLEEAGALLLLLAKAGQLDARDLGPDDPARGEAAETSGRLCDLAGPCFEPDRRPRALLEQRADLARLRGLDAEAAGLLAEAARVPLRTALDHELAATSLSLRGEYREALPLAREATRLAPGDFWAWFRLGRCHQALGRGAEAVACFGTCIALRPDSPFGWYNRGTALADRGDYGPALLDFERASALDPAWPEPYAYRAIAENLAGRPADAVRDFSRAIELGAGGTRIYLQRADARARAGDAEGAKLDRAEGLRRGPRDDLDYVARAMCRVDADPAAALADLDRALALSPRSLDALLDKAYILAEKLGRLVEAEAVFGRAVSSYPDSVPARSSRGVLRALLGRREAAHLDARESLRRDTSPRTLYQVAGIYAVTSKLDPGDKFEAYRLLSTALRNGFGFDYLAVDRELDPIRDQPEFRKILEAARALQGVAPGPPRTSDHAAPAGRGVRS